jgi:hypothetical protein
MKLPQHAITLASVTDGISTIRRRTITTTATPILPVCQDKEALEFQCPDCSSLLSVYYDKLDCQRYYCENCEQDVTAEEIISEWDSPRGKSNDDYESDSIIIIIDDDHDDNDSEICDLPWV